MSQSPIIFEDLDPPKRLLMGPGPVDVYPSVLEALGKPMLGLFARLLPKARIPIHSYLALYKVRVKHFGNARRFMQEDPLALEHITLGTLASLASTHLPNPLAAITLPVFVLFCENK